MSRANPNLTAGRPSIKNRKDVSLASLADAKETKRVNFNLPVEDHIKLKVYAAREGKSVTEVMSEYIATLPDK